MFEVQYNDEMEAEIKRLEAEALAKPVGHPGYVNGCNISDRNTESTSVARLHEDMD